MPLSLLITLIASVSLLASSALIAWSLVSRSTRRAKQPPSSPTTQNSSEALATLVADQAALFSAFEKMALTVKRLSSRAGMRDVRDRQATEAPPKGTPKAELLRHYGMSGKVGPEFAQAQLRMERERDTEH